MKHCFFLTLLASANFAAIHLLQADCHQLIYRPEVNHIALVVDRSGSMAGQPLADAKRGGKAFLRQMQPTGRAALISTIRFNWRTGKHQTKPVFPEQWTISGPSGQRHFTMPAPGRH